MDPTLFEENPTLEKPGDAWKEEFSLSKGSCCDEGVADEEAPLPDVP